MLHVPEWGIFIYYYFFFLVKNIAYLKALEQNAFINVNSLKYYDDECGRKGEKGT